MDPEQARGLLERVGKCAALHRSPRLRDLLVDIGERSIAGKSEELSEQAIGVRLFGRSEGYSSTEDNIVRASVRQLRLKLKEHFETEGSGETWLLEIPKGGYVAVFAPREAPRTQVGELAPASDGAPASLRAGVPWPYWALLAVAVAGAAACGVLVTRWWSAREAHGPTATPASGFFAALMTRNTEPVRFVMTDSTLVIMSRLRGGGTKLDEYSSGTYATKGVPPAGFTEESWRFLTARQITSLADVLILSRLYRESGEAGRRIEVQYARHMRMRDFKSGNFVIVGSPNSNPWTSLFDASLNFQFELNPTRIRNLNPAGNEPRMLEARGAGGPDYARIALVPNLSGGGFVLLIGGIEAQGTEGAGEFVLRADSLEKVRKALGIGAGEPIPPCEFILEIQTLQSAAQSAEIIAARRH